MKDDQIVRVNLWSTVLKYSAKLGIVIQIRSGEGLTFQTGNEGILDWHEFGTVLTAHSVYTPRYTC